MNYINVFRYDFILTSETVYSQASYHKLHSVMEALLKQDGEMFVCCFVIIIFFIHLNECIKPFTFADVSYS